MILNHKEAIEMLVEQSDEVGMSRITLLNLHAVLSENLMADTEASGRLRSRPTPDLRDAKQLLETSV
jgi:hypothetical protein